MPVTRVVASVVAAGANHLDAATGYREHLERFIAEARAREATPVLVTSMHRRLFHRDGRIDRALGPVASRTPVSVLPTGDRIRSHHFR
jgi:hypothetical protein